MTPLKAHDADIIGRFREIISDPLNLLIERVPMAGIVDGYEVYLHNGNRVPITGEGTYYGPFSQILAINRGVHEPLEEYAFQELLKTLSEAPSMIELGAYWGHYSMWLKRVKPLSSVILVEPDHNNLKAGVRNFSRNGYQGEFIQAVVDKNHFEVDSFLKSRTLASLDILHADIQGAEVQMLEGCQSSLEARLVKYLLISTHSQELHGQTTDKLSNLGYRVEISSDVDNDATSFDGFVFASSPEVSRIFVNFRPLGRTTIVQSCPSDLLRELLEAQKHT
jgi:hypothetical protein